MKIADMIEILKNSKLSTILLVSVLLYSSFNFVKGENSLDSPSALIGGAIALVAILFSVFSYADYRAREKIDHIISKYEIALNHISSTHSKYEKDQRGTFAKSKEKIGSDRKGSGYNVEYDEYSGTADDITNV